METATTHKVLDVNYNNIESVEVFRGSKEECEKLIEYGKANPVQRRISYSEVAGGRYLESSGEVDVKAKDLFDLLDQRTEQAARIYLNKK